MNRSEGRASVTDKKCLNIEQELFLSQAIHAAQISVFELDLKTMHYAQLVNAEAILSKSSQEIDDELSVYDGLEPEEYRARILDYFYDAADHPRVSAAFQTVLTQQKADYYARIKVGDYAYVWCQINLVLHSENGRPTAVIGAVSNVDRLMRQSEAYREKAERDSMTQLLNKSYTESCIARIFDSKRMRSHALLLMDLDDFKQVNDRYGHREGDHVLCGCAENLLSLFRRTDIIGRWGGDEFVVLMTDIADETILHSKLEQVLARQAAGGRATCSIGVAVFPRDGKTLDEIFSKADQALYLAKRMKNTYVIYSPELAPGENGK